MGLNKYTDSGKYVEAAYAGDLRSSLLFFILMSCNGSKQIMAVTMKSICIVVYLVSEAKNKIKA